MKNGGWVRWRHWTESGLVAFGQMPMGSNSVSKSVVQNVNINNKFEGDRAGQQKSAAAMDKAAGDSTGEMARALAYAR